MFGVWTVARSGNHALVAGMVVHANSQELDVVDYQRHWLVTSAAYTFASAIGLIAGTAMLLRKPFALRMLALSFGCFLSFAAWKLASGYVKYAFEVVPLVEFPIWLLLIALALVWDRRARRVARA